jgi:hypothetical protein
MRVFQWALIVVTVVGDFGLARAAGGVESVCLKVNGENVEIRGLTQEPIAIDREGVPDFVATSMMKSVSTATESESYNILLSGVKRDAKKAITSFTLKVDEKAYSYPGDACGR